MDSVAKVEYNVRNLTTRSVTLFPTRAQVFRDIKDVPLQPGTNEITIFGLTPTVDEDSIKVEGSGSAIISDIAIESLPNRDIFEEVYPEYDDDEDEDDSLDESSSDEEVSITESPELKDAKRRSRELDDRIKQAKELVASAERRRHGLDDYTKTLSCEHGVNVKESMDQYREARETLFDDHMEGERIQRELKPEVEEVRAEIARLTKVHEKAKRRANRNREKTLAARKKAKMTQNRRDREAQNEKERIKKERLKFWPKYCYAVHITIEASAFTPMTSRRGSMSSDVEIIDERSDTPTMEQTGRSVGTCDLVLSYATSSAGWSPSYDLQLSTTNSHGVLCFDAQLNNSTSETWEKCKLTLSTSQSTSSSLDDVAPVLQPWRIKLNNNSSSPSDNALLESSQERNHKSALRSKNAQTSSGKPRSEMFGVGANASNHALQDHQMQLMLLEQQNKKRIAKARAEQDAPLPPPPPAPAPAPAPAGYGSSAFAGAAFGNAMPPPQARARKSMAPLMSNAPPIQQAQQQQQQPQQQQQQWPQQSAPTGDVLNDFDFDAFIHEEEMEEDSDEQQKLDFEESLVEESGFTTTFEVPSLKTLAPRSTPSKQRIARINFANVVFSHTVVAKYKPAAHLSAKLQNNSKLTLLRGPVGVTLDGSFMGRTTLPRCGSGGESIRLSLGVDQAVKVHYASPEMKRATTGLFTKEDIKVYTRVIRLENTRTSVDNHTKLRVLDQVPVSRDEKLRIELLKPEGLVPECEGKAAGEPGRDKDKEGWGTAEAKLLKDGEVQWLVALRPGKSVKLLMEYLVATPIGESAIQA